MELNELKEQAEKAHDPFDRRVATSMAIIAASLALVAVYGHITTTEELLMQQKASDEWAFYQAKSLRRYQSDATRDILTAMSGDAASGLAKKYQANMERYQKEGGEIQEKARDFERESAVSGRRALRLHLGEIFLEVAIVFASLAILTKRSPVFWMSLASAGCGSLIAVTALLIRA